MIQKGIFCTTKFIARRWSVIAKYAMSILCGIFLFRVGQAFAYHQRGYFAVGGEVFFLLLPLAIFMIDIVEQEYRQATEKDET